jgi:hypothetical protein
VLAFGSNTASNDVEHGSIRGEEHVQGAFQLVLVDFLGEVLDEKPT